MCSNNILSIGKGCTASMVFTGYQHVKHGCKIIMKYSREVHYVVVLDFKNIKRRATLAARYVLGCFLRKHTLIILYTRVCNVHYACGYTPIQGYSPCAMFKPRKMQLMFNPSRHVKIIQCTLRLHLTCL